MRRRDSGFTLLEMLVALVVFGFVMAGLAQTFRFGLVAWSATTRRSVGPENLAAMDAALTQMIAQAHPDTMTGLPQGLAFTTRLPAGAGLNGGLADAAIMVAPGNILILRYSAHPPGIPLVRPPPPRVEILAHGVTGLKVAYLMPQLGGHAPDWFESWSNSGLPILIRIHLDFANGQIWPDLIVAPINPDN